nr:tropomyosin-2-like [Aegilops tauschii subsp. strangulata]
MSRSGSQGKWVASFVKEKDIKELREAGYLSADVAHRIPAKKQASLLAATAQATEVSELKRKLELADEDLIRINMRFDEAQGSAAEVETLKGDLARAKEQARVSQAAADKAAADLKAEQVACRRYEERVTEVEQELKDATDKCEALEEKNKAQAADLTKALQGAKEARTESRAAREEIKQAEQIAANAFADLPKSAADASQYFRAQEGNTTAKLFWSQYLALERPALLNDQMMQLAELHRMSGLAMKYVIVRLWPTEPIPSSYFGLVKRLTNALPRIEAVKRSACIEGARMVFARVKMQWAKIKATVAAEGPPEGKDHRKPEQYFDDVLEGARIVEGQCSKDIVFE